MSGTRRTLLALAGGLAAVALLVLAGCGGPSAPGGAQAGAVVIEASDFKFSPDKLELKVNQPVTIAFKNTGTVLHDLMIQGLRIQIGNETKDILHVEADPGKEATVTFTPLDTGEFTIFCDVPGHRELGMTGTVVVRR